MSEPTDAGIQDPGGPTAPCAARGRPHGADPQRSCWRCVLVLAVAAAVWLGLKAEAADERQQERAAAASVASQFALRMDNVDGTNFDSYIKGINELLTTKAKTKNKKTFDAIKQSYEAAKVKGTGKVLLTAVGDADDDSATVLVVHDASVKHHPGQHRPPLPLVGGRGEGRWRVAASTTSTR